MGENSVTVVDYGTGNLFSVRKALEQQGARVFVSSQRKEIEKAERLVLPGVGAFGNAIKKLHDASLVNSILEFSERQRPLLGICLGMQLFASNSLEFGFHEGLDLIPGMVKEIQPGKDNIIINKVPRIGWCPLGRPLHADGWEGTILKGLDESDEVYLVHSFHFVPQERASVIAQSRYGEEVLSIALQRNNVCGCQFHPEKSALVGLKVLNNFMYKI